MSLRVPASSLALLGLAFGLGLALASPSGASSTSFPRPAALEPAVEFWSRIFATYSEHQVVVHDAWDLGKVYEVLDFRGWYADGEPETDDLRALRKARVEDAKQRVRAILLRLDELGGSAGDLTAEEAKVRDLYRGSPNLYREAADRVRGQAGLRERFAAGIARQSRYLDRMQAIFAARGMPEDLARLPLVESCFNVDAYSKVGAAGVWQFMPATGRLYMRVNEAVDERRDPIRATHAAAEHLSRDYDALGTWPLALTAYNHGRGGVARGVGETGTTDIGVIATRYRGPAFGFASRNFYAEFLAALDVTGRAAEYFGELPTLPPLDAIEVEIERPIQLGDAARRVGVDREELIELNPALMSLVTRGGVPVPRGYVLRVPRGPVGSEAEVASALSVGGEEVRVAAARSRGGSRSARKASPRGQTVVAASSGGSANRVVVHRVSRGQTLIDIARRYGTTVAMIQGLNNLRQPKALQAGQRLKVPRNT